jgi:UDP:flavonoid glycosyltransferase YjiC (YdhE family)
MMQTQGMDGYFLVIAAGHKLNTQLRGEYGLVPGGTSILPANVALRDWVSQLDVLGNPTTAVAFLHGGLATIKEAMWKEVPIVIVPHGKDQLENARRIARAGVGLVPEVGEPTPEQLRQLLTSATASTWIRQNLAKFRDIFEVDENKPANQKPSVGVINGVLAAP